jgi:hypothetical protein
VCLVEDPVLADRLRGHAEASADPPTVALVVDEQVRVGCRWPATRAVVEVGGEPFADGIGGQDRLLADVEAAVAQVGER